MTQRQMPVALVTGASRNAGIGAAIARQMARAGIEVFVTYFRPYDQETGLAGDMQEPQTLIEELRSCGVRADGLELDLAAPDAALRLFDVAEASLGTITILVNNAAYSMRDGIEHLTAEQIDRHYAVNMRAMMLLCREFVCRYKRAGAHAGRIINMTSGQGVGPMPGELAYVATKGAVDAFTVSLSAEVAPLGITVNAVDPGITDTGWIPPDMKSTWEAEAPFGRVGSPEDAARLARFLAGPEAAWITGQILRSRGGL